MKKLLSKHLLHILTVFALFLLLTACGSAGYDEGYITGYEAAKEELEQPSYTRGYDDGYDDGYEKGLADGSVSTDSSGETPNVTPDVSPVPDVSPKPDEPSDSIVPGFVLVTDVIPDAVLEIRYYSGFNFVGTRIDGYEAPVAYLTKEAAEALKNVSDELMEKGYRLKIYDAYRPQAAVDHFKAWAKDIDDTAMQQYFYPELDKAALFEQGYIAARSGHSRGSTVDLTLIDMATGRDIDMGGGFDYFGELSHPGYGGLTQEQADNRRILRDAMTAHGFRAIDTEWWHFTLKNEPYPDTYFDFPITIPAK